MSGGTNMIGNFEITYITDYNSYLMEEASAVFNEDGTFNRLRIEEEEYRSLEVKDAQKRAKEHIKEQKGISYKNILTSNTILIDDKTANEYIYSCYTRWSKTDMKYVKCILANYIKELFMNASSKSYEANQKNKHNFDAKYGFYKYGVKFSIVDNDKETIYTCSLLVRNDANGKKYLYDILDIKKINQVSLKECFQTT